MSLAASSVASALTNRSSNMGPSRSADINSSLYRYKCIEAQSCMLAEFRGSIGAVERKPQQQTLSIRISDTLREFLERSKQILSSGRGESVSTSDVAKILLESAKEDRLDFRLEVADLQQDPTTSLVGIRRKWQGKQPLSRSEWVFLSQYIQVATEDLTQNR